jgi:hypothetical protein
MDEIEALKYIFKQQFNEETKAVIFNSKTYSYTDYVRDSQHSKTFFSYILQNEETVESSVNVKPQIDAQVVEVEKITEEQFKEWKLRRKSEVVDDKMTGKAIWLEQKRRGENNLELN